MRPWAPVPALLVVATAMANDIPERYNRDWPTWQSLLDKGAAVQVRRLTETILQQEGPLVNSSDYEAMNAIVFISNVAAKACIQEGAWEDGIEHLRRAAKLSAQNTLTAQDTLARPRKQNMEKLAEWRETVLRQTQALADLDAQPGLTSEQAKQRIQLRRTLEEYKAAIAQGEKALAENEDKLVQLRGTQEAFAKSLAEWETFLAKEKEDVAQSGSTSKYVAEKLDQVKADDARPRLERLTYGRRLLKLEPANGDTQRFVNALMGVEDEKEKAPTAKQPAPRKKKKAKKG